MKKAITLVILSLFTLAAHAQRFDWVKTYTGPDISDMTTNKIVGSCVDNEGNLYILGEFSPQAQLCGVDLLPHEIITTPLRRAVLIAKLSPQGVLLWHKAIYGTNSSYAKGLRQLNDTSFMIMTSLTLPYDLGYGQYNNLFYLDTLLTGNSNHLMPTDSIGEFTVNAFITFNMAGNVIEQHFLCVGWQDTNGNTLTPQFFGQSTMEKMFCRVLSSETFITDYDGNIYVLRTSNDYEVNVSTGQEWSIVDGTIGALKIMVDGEHPLFYHPDQRSARWNQQILKFAPHFDSLLSAVYVFDSTHNHLSYTSVDVNDLGIDSQGNLYINLMGHNVSSSLMVSNSDSLTVDITANKPTMMIKYTPNLRAVSLAQLSNAGDSSEYIQTNILYSNMDENTNSIFLSGSVGWPRSFSVNGVLYNNDTLDISNNDAYWIRLNMDNLELLSYGKAQAGEGGIVFEPMLATQHNRVFAQTNFSTSLSFNGATVNIPNTGGRDNIFLVWDNEGHELSAIDYNSFNPDNLYSNPIVIDSVVYLIGTLYSNATFGTELTNGGGNSYAYISRYIDSTFMSPYINNNPSETQSIEWQQELSFSLSNSPIALTATSTSGLPVSYLCNDTTIAAIEGSMLYLLTEGETLLTAYQEGDSHYLPAEEITKTLRVTNEEIENTSPESFVVYPNPAKDAVYYSFNKKIQEIRVLSSTGNPVEFTFTNNKVDISKPC